MPTDSEAPTAPTPANPALRRRLVWIGVAAVVTAYPDTLGVIRDLSGVADEVHKAGALFVVCADLLALTLLKPPGEFGADICVGNSQRFGVPLGFGGPHAAFMAVKDALKA